jgi:hypothetical protein
MSIRKRKLKVLSSEMDLPENRFNDRSSIKSEAQRFQKNWSIPHSVKAL